MAFHPRKVLTHLSVNSIRRHFDSTDPDLALEIDWSLAVKELLEKLEALLLGPSGRHTAQVTILQRVHLMATELGDRAMVAACRGDVGLRQALSAHVNAHERALWLLNHDPVRFEQAEDIRHMDHGYGTRSWSGFIGPRDAWPELSGEPMQIFERRVETAFRQYDGSGSNIVVDQFERAPASIGRYGEGRVLQLVAYLEGLPATSTEFAENGVVRRNVRPAVEVSLVYASQTGVIDVVTRAGRPLREEVAKAFVEELFPQSGAIERIRLRELALSNLARPQHFAVEPEDGIESVRLTALRFSPDGSTGRLTLEAGPKEGPALHELARSWFGPSDPLARGPSIKRARIAIKFAAGNGRRRPRTLPLELTEPHGCNLRDRSDEERLIGEKYLKLWQLVREV